MQLEINVVDAFTDTAFKGNPAAVIITDNRLCEDLMQSIAMENNLPETAFLVPDESDEKGAYYICWFSPTTEIAFCGHATLASAFVLFKKNPNLRSIRLLTKTVGELAVVHTGSGEIQMNFPNTKPKKVEYTPSFLLEGLSIAPIEVYRNDQAYFVIYHSENDVLTVKRDNVLLKQIAPLKLVITCLSETKDYDFISRYFVPVDGGIEDPVTGSIHTGLAPFWAERLNKNDLIAYQASSRGGILKCTVKEDRVLISGNAVRYLTGFINI